MSVLEAMAKAAWEAENGEQWELVSDLSQKKLCGFMRAALRALAEAELSDDLLKEMSLRHSSIKPGRIEFVREIIRSTVRALANEGMDDGRD